MLLSGKFVVFPFIYEQDCSGMLGRFFQSLRLTLVFSIYLSFVCMENFVVRPDNYSHPVAVPFLFCL